jgi:hypothetical protein
MLHTCVQRFDVVDGRGNILGLHVKWTHPKYKPQIATTQGLAGPQVTIRWRKRMPFSDKLVAGEGSISINYKKATSHNIMGRIKSTCTPELKPHNHTQYIPANSGTFSFLKCIVSRLNSDDRHNIAPWSVKNTGLLFPPFLTFYGVYTMCKMAKCLARAEHCSDESQHIQIYMLLGSHQEKGGDPFLMPPTASVSIGSNSCTTAV